MSTRFSLGRADAHKADILLQGSTISAMHAELSIDSQGNLLISDLGSSNGTTILRNGQSISVSSKAISLKPGDTLSLGGNKFSINEILRKQPKGRASSPKAVPSNAGVGSGRRMMRCLSCGSVTPQGRPCVECGYNG